MDIRRTTGTLGGPGIPDSLNLDWDLRTPNEALTPATEANNGFFVFRAPGFDLTSNSDVIAWLDQSEGLNLQAAEYESDFSSGVDGFDEGDVNCTLTVEDNILLEDDVLRMTLTGGAATHYAWKNIAPPLTAGRIYKYSIDVLMGFGNSAWDMVQFGSLLGSSLHCLVPTAAGVWETFEGYMATTGFGDLNILALADEDTTVDGDGDSFWFKNIVFQEVDGKHLIQTNPDDMPHWDNTALTIDFDGTDDHMDDYRDRFQTAHFGDTAGEFIQVFDDDEGPSGSVGFLTFIENGDFSNDYFAPFLYTSNDIQNQFIIGGTNNEVFFGTHSRSAGSRETVFMGSDGSNYYCRADGAEKSVTSGTDDGNWLGDNPALDTMQVGEFAGLLYEQLGGRGFFYRSSAFSSQERTDFETWLDSNV